MAGVVILAQIVLDPHHLHVRRWTLDLFNAAEQVCRRGEEDSGPADIEKARHVSTVADYRLLDGAVWVLDARPLRPPFCLARKRMRAERA